jgi:hypothetical protein
MRNLQLQGAERDRTIEVMQKARIPAAKTVLPR